MKNKNKLKSAFDLGEMRKSSHGAAFAVLLIKVAHVGFSILLTVLLTRSIGLEGLGFYATIFSFSNIISALISGGLVVFIMRELPSHIANMEIGNVHYIVSIYKKYVLTTFIASVLVSVFLFWGFQNSVGFFVFLMTPLLVFSKLRSALIRASGKTIESQIEMLTMLAISTAIITVSVLAGIPLDEVSAIGIVLLSMCVVSANRFCRVKAIFAFPNDRYKDDGTRFDDYKTIMTLGVVAFVQVLFAEIGVLSIQMVGDRVDVGLIKAMTELSGVVGLMFIILNLVYSRELSLSLRNEETEKVEHISKKCAFASLCCAVPLSIPLIFFPDTTIRLIYGASVFEAGADTLQWLAVSQLANCALGPVMMIATLSGFHKEIILLLLKTFLFCFLLNMFLYVKFGVVGVAFGMMVVVVIWKIVISIKLRKHKKINIGIFAGYRKEVL